MKSKYGFFIKGILLFLVGYFIFQISLSYRHEKDTEQLVMQKEVMKIAQIVDAQKEIAIQERIDEAVWKAEQKWKRLQSEQPEGN